MLLCLLHILFCLLCPWSDCGLGFRLSSIPSSTSCSILLSGGSLTLHVLCVRHRGERNYISTSQSGCQWLFTLVTAQKILSSVTSFCFSSSVYQETSPPQEWRASSPHCASPFCLDSKALLVGTSDLTLLTCQNPGQTFLLLRSDLLCHFSELTS